ncbi:MAG: hypothetical protein IT343_21180 [Candidatus Melainabacteria bacterium]|jgi:hypothetical protein|nr:hypothetical protein [Candidatus Melainabacteria bacterium]
MRIGKNTEVKELLEKYPDCRRVFESHGIRLDEADPVFSDIALLGELNMRCDADRLARDLQIYINLHNFNYENSGE